MQPFLAGFRPKRRVSLGGLAYAFRDWRRTMGNTTDTEVAAVPRGWPPEQPVEVVRISRALCWIVAGIAIVNVAGFGYALCLLWQISEAVHRIALAGG